MSRDIAPKGATPSFADEKIETREGLFASFFLPTDANIVKMVNRGIEFALSYSSSVGKLKYNVGGNITTVHNVTRDS